MSDTDGSVSPALALAIGAVLFVATGIAGFGIISAATGAEPIAVPGLPVATGALGFALAVVGYGAALWPALRARPPSYLGSALTAPAALLGYLLGTGVAAASRGMSEALAASGSFVLSWFSIALVLAACVTGWITVALVRTRARAPRWPWEDEHDDPQ